MLNVRLAGGHLYGKQLFTWLSLVVSLIASFCAHPFLPLDVLDEIWDVIESVSEGFLTYSVQKKKKKKKKLQQIYICYGARDDISVQTLLVYSRIFGHQKLVNSHMEILRQFCEQDLNFMNSEANRLRIASIANPCT